MYLTFFENITIWQRFNLEIYHWKKVVGVNIFSFTDY